MAPIPENETVLITLDYLKAKNVASRGSVHFTPPRFTHPNDHIINPAPCPADVVDGEGSIRLIPSDAGTFAVTEYLDGQEPFTWHINLPSGLAGQTRSLFSFAPVQPIIQGISTNTLLSGIGAPSALTGIDGDYYYDVQNKFWYGPKALGAWPAGFSVIGPPGANGTNGTNGTDGVDGDDGADGLPGAPHVAEAYGFVSASVDPDALRSTYSPGQDMWSVRVPMPAGRPLTKIGTIVATAGVLTGPGGNNGFRLTSDDGQTVHFTGVDTALWSQAGVRSIALGGAAIPAQPTLVWYRVQMGIHDYSAALSLPLCEGASSFTEDANKRVRLGSSAAGFQGPYNPLTFGFTASGTRPLVMLG